jgi:hypothetical protein
MQWAHALPPECTGDTYGTATPPAPKPYTSSAAAACCSCAVVPALRCAATATVAAAAAAAGPDSAMPSTLTMLPPAGLPPRLASTSVEVCMIWIAFSKALSTAPVSTGAPLTTLVLAWWYASSSDSSCCACCRYACRVLLYHWYREPSWPWTVCSAGPCKG